MTPAGSRPSAQPIIMLSKLALLNLVQREAPEKPFPPRGPLFWGTGPWWLLHPVSFSLQLCWIKPPLCIHLLLLLLFQGTSHFWMPFRAAHSTRKCRLRPVLMAAAPGGPRASQVSSLAFLPQVWEPLVPHGGPQWVPEYLHFSPF